MNSLQAQSYSLSFFFFCAMQHSTISIFTNDGHGAGYITAQGRTCPESRSGFVFKYSTIVGSGKAYLGRAYRPYSTVVIYKTYMSDVVVPQGWDAWDYVRNEYDPSFVSLYYLYLLGACL